MTHRLAALERRAAAQEAALLDMLQRVQQLEQSLAFEVSQREAMEQIILQLAAVGLRLDRLELVAKALRQGRAA